MSNKSRKLDVGRDAVVMGNDVTGNVGDGSVVIGATDDRGNTILNTSMAVGRGATAGPDSIAIGAGAHAGSSGENRRSWVDVLKNFEVIAGLIAFCGKAVGWFRSWWA